MIYHLFDDLFAISQIKKNLHIFSYTNTNKFWGIKDIKGRTILPCEYLMFVPVGKYNWLACNNFDAEQVAAWPISFDLQYTYFNKNGKLENKPIPYSGVISLISGFYLDYKDPLTYLKRAKGVLSI